MLSGRGCGVVNDVLFWLLDWALLENFFIILGIEFWVQKYGWAKSP
ncbi:hypothetical protein [Granulicatella seriolae]|uniref:Uncharacterized protein n=1 Tax=Granulicatella seriolae TaxID=2967226 RepID=A0ABT1WQU1_9LACT|nr:hypothetical protein [Granulicatella seriolae]